MILHCQSVHSKCDFIQCNFYIKKYSYKSLMPIWSCSQSLTEILEVQTHTQVPQKPKHTLTQTQSSALPPEFVAWGGGSCCRKSSGKWAGLVVPRWWTAVGTWNPVHLLPGQISHSTQTHGSFTSVLLIHCNACVCAWMIVCVWPREPRQQKVNTWN